MSKPDAPLRNNLREIRTRLGLSQQELADQVSVTRQAISAIEAGQSAPSTTIALRLVRALGCRLEDLFWLDEPAPVLEAVPAQSFPVGEPARLALARVGGRWVAHPLSGEQAFRTELLPADGEGLLEAEVCHGASSLQVRLLDEPENLANTVAVAGCTPALSLWARAAERWHPGLRVHWTFANSTAALEALARGEIHAAGSHLYDEATGEHNAPIARRLLPGRRLVLVNLAIWEEGLLVRQGNPKGLRRGADLAQCGVRLVNREPGAGARQLLERTLVREGVDPRAVAGFERIAHSHVEVAQAVAAGEADAGVSAASVASAYGLGFVPLHQVRYDMVIPREYLEEVPVRQWLSSLNHRWVRSQLEALGGYDTSLTGEVVAAIDP
ncbi:MAG: substrate-binding domain-containing protein [Bacillota bacterium]